MRKLIILILSSVLLLEFMIFMHGCEKEVPLPENPFDSINYGDTTTVGLVTIEPNSITDLHKRIFQAKCSVPGCHDGNFEPDFRTVQSTYASLVYHPLIKNNANNDFTYRVVPNDLDMSVLHERITNCCFVNVDDRMPQDNIGVPLPDQDIKDIETWILSGAKDMFGNTPSLPNNAASVIYYDAFNDDYSVVYSEKNNRIDSLWVNPFIVPNNDIVNVVMFVTDDQTPIGDMQVNQLKLSYDKDNFVPFATITANYFKPSYTDYWIAQLNTADFPSDTTIYMRYYVNDGNQPDDTEFPENISYPTYKTYWAFYVQP